MSITNELREYIRKHTLRWADPEHPSGGSCALDPQTSPDMLRAIADRIDAEHQKAIRELNNLAEASVLLPKDADGEVIRAGDRLDGYGKTITVVEMRYGRSGWVLISEYGNAYADTFAFTHHHAPTVEDVLEEFVARWMETHHDDIPALKAEFAKRLTLAEGEGA